MSAREFGLRTMEQRVDAAVVVGLYLLPLTHPLLIPLVGVTPRVPRAIPSRMAGRRGGSQG